jgi:hypothetical protein
MYPGNFLFRKSPSGFYVAEDFSLTSRNRDVSLRTLATVDADKLNF